MCASIKNLRALDHPPTEEDFSKAALQFVRKISGFKKPSKLNQAAFEKAVSQISNIAEDLLDELIVIKI